MPFFVLIVWLFLAIGWVLNIYRIVVAVSGEALGEIVITGFFILRVVGVFVAPLGGILGYFPG